MRKLHLAEFQHTPEEPIGYFETICREWNISYNCISLFETNEAPIPRTTHLLLLGGPMSGKALAERFFYNPESSAKKLAKNLVSRRTSPT